MVKAIVYIKEIAWSSMHVCH